MIVLQKLLVVVLASHFISAKTIVSGFEELRSTEAGICVMKEISRFFMLVTNTGNISLTKTMWYMDGKKFKCPCDHSNYSCIMLCCSLNQVQIYGNCVENNITDDILPVIKIPINYDNEKRIGGNNDKMNFLMYINNPCDYGWMISVISTNYKLLENGSIYDFELGRNSLSNFNQYCLFREPKTTYYSARICRQWVKFFYWDILGAIIASLVMMMILIIYTVVPQLKNLHGMMLRSYLASYLCAYASAIILELIAKSRNHAIWFYVSLYSLEYWGVSCVFWLNAMSIDIWRTVRSLRSIDSYYQERKRKKFIWYAIFAWFSPLVLFTGHFAILYYVQSLHDIEIGQDFRKYIRVTIKFGFLICNTSLYISTSILIKRHKRDIENLSASVNKHHNGDKQWINLHVKLYLIMIGHIIPWISWDIWPRPETTTSLIVLEVLQSLFLLYVFICKNNIKRSLLDRFGKRPG